MSRLVTACFLPALLMAASPDAVAGASSTDTVLEEIIVTGTLRGQLLQDAAASVTVLDEKTLAEAGQQHLQDVLALVPNLNWAAGTSRPRYFQIRGIGEREQYEGAPNPSVGFLIDDIDFSGLGMPATLFDVQQVEVLRGPQGTQYGANALAGLMVVRGKSPEREAAYALEGSVADYGTRSLGAAATGPVGATDSAWRLSVQGYGSDGFMNNVALGRDDTNDRKELTARAKWRSWLRGAGVLDFTFLHADIDNGYDAWTLDGSRNTQTNEPGMDQQRTNAASLRFEGDGPGSGALTAIASHARSRTHYGYDYDWGNTGFWSPWFYEGAERWDRERRTSSAELRLASPLAGEEGGIAWLGGAYVLRLEEDGRYTSAGEYIDAFDSAFDWTDERLIDDRYHANSLALFGQLDGVLAQGWRWSAGLRLEQRRARYRDSGEVNGTPQLSDFSARDRMLGGQLSVSRDFSAALTGYALLSRGYKAGGFNLGAVPDELRDFDPEFLWNLESGVKARLADGRGHADFAVFYQRRKDQQVRSGRQLVTGGPYDYVTTNLSDGYSTGIEASILWQLLPQVEVGASLGLLRSRTGETVSAAGDPVASRASAHAPGYTAAVNATWRHPGGLFARVDMTATDDFYFDVPTDHNQKSRAYTLTHVKVGFEHGQWSIQAWLRNAFDKQYAVRGFYFANNPAAGWVDELYRQLGDPRQLGVTVAVDF
jgi:outer membrane receptor protein involved in Fe transport